MTRPALTFVVEDLPGGAAQRLAEAILRVCALCAHEPAFSLTRLGAILFDADFEAFARRGRPVTGAAYQRQAAGPAPAELAQQLGALERAGALRLSHDYALGPAECRPIAIRPALLRLFDAEDLAFLDLAAARPYTTKTRAVWRTREDDDLIPYEAAWLSDAPVSAAEVAHTRALAAVHGW